MMTANLPASSRDPLDAAGGTRRAPRFAPNLRWLFTEWPLRERFAAARAAGFDAVEFSPHDDVTPEELATLLGEHGLVDVCALTPLRWAAGERGLAGLPDRIAQFRDSALRGLEFAVRCGIPQLHPASGELPDGASRDACLAVYRDNLAWFAERARAVGVTVVFEPVCTARFARFLVHRLDEAIAIIDAVGAPNLKLVFDTWHVQMEEGSPAQRLDEVWPYVGHVQLGNPPGRHEPGEGELDLLWFVDRFLDKGYTGAIGLEYTPRHDTASSLRWARRYGIEVRDAREAQR